MNFGKPVKHLLKQEPKQTMAMAVETAAALLTRAATQNGSTTTMMNSNFDKKSGVKHDGDPSTVDESQQLEPEVDIVINNVVCSFNVRCHLNLRDIALRGLNVEYRKENGVMFC